MINIKIVFWIDTFYTFYIIWSAALKFLELYPLFPVLHHLKTFVLGMYLENRDKIKILCILYQIYNLIYI